VPQLCGPELFSSIFVSDAKFFTKFASMILHLGIYLIIADKI